MAVLEERLNTALALKDEKIQEIKDRTESIYKVLGLIGGITALMVLFLAIRDVILRNKEGERKRGIDDIVKETMKLQQAAMSQQLSLGAIQVSAAVADPARHLERVQNVNEVIDTVQKTLAFRLEQERRVADVIKTIEKLENERERKNKQKFESAMSILDSFKTMNRMQFAALTCGAAEARNQAGREGWRSGRLPQRKRLSGCRQHAVYVRGHQLLR